MQNQLLPVIENNKQNDNIFNQQELLMIKNIFLKRHRMVLYKDEIIYCYYTRIVYFNLKRKTVRLNQMKKEVELRKLPLTKPLLTKLYQDIKELMRQQEKQKNSNIASQSL